MFLKFYTQKDVEALLNELAGELGNLELERVKEMEMSLFDIRVGSVPAFKLKVVQEMERIWGYGSSHLGRLS